MAENPFDTLKYAKALEQGGVDLSHIHTLALSDAMTQNIYTKNEVDKMIEAALKQFHERTLQMKEEWRIDFDKSRAEFNETLRKFDERTNQIRDKSNTEFNESLKRFDERTREMQLEMKDIEKGVERTINRQTYALIGILGTLNIAAGFAAAFIHYFAH